MVNYGINLIHMLDSIQYEFWFLFTTQADPEPELGARSRSQNFDIPAPAPAKSSGSLRLQLHNTVSNRTTQLTNRKQEIQTGSSGKDKFLLVKQQGKYIRGRKENMWKVQSHQILHFILETINLK
jgi:hypothetical protein